MTGNRRFWPVRVTRYERDSFLRDRAQIFAEAVAMAQTEKLWLDDEKLYDRAILAQERRMEPNPYYEKLGELMGIEVGDEERIFNRDVWQFLGLDVPSQAASKAIVDAMRKYGWERRKLRIGKEGPTWGFVRIR